MERPHPKRAVAGNRNTLMRGFKRFENHVAAYLMHLRVTPLAAEHSGQAGA